MKFDLTKEAYEKDIILDLKTACLNLREAIIDINDLSIRQRLIYCIDRAIKRIGIKSFYKVYSEVVEISDIAKESKGEKVTVKFMERLEELWSILDEVMSLVRSGNLSITN